MALVIRICGENNTGEQMPTKNLYLIFNHTFTLAQEMDARKSLGVAQIILMPEYAREVWANVPPELVEIRGYLEPVRTWLSDSSEKGDYVLVQGDFGACYLIVNFAFENGLIPIYSTTRRQAIEEHQPNGPVRMTHYFHHQRFRIYEQ
jgi:hypothetical protein